jgi:hypothetical protein
MIITQQGTTAAKNSGFHRSRTVASAAAGTCPARPSASTAKRGRRHQKPPGEGSVIDRSSFVHEPCALHIREETHE